MGMSTWVLGFRPPDDKWRQMKNTWDACNRAEVTVPEEVEKFFNYGPPDDAGIKINLDEKHGVTEWNDDSREGFEVELSKLPKNITRIRFVNAW